MTPPEWWDVGRNLLKAALAPATAEELAADHAQVLSKVPHRDDCSSTIAFSPGPCDCGRDLAMHEIRSKLQTFLAALTQPRSGK